MRACAYSVIVRPLDAKVFNPTVGVLCSRSLSLTLLLSVTSGNEPVSEHVMRGSQEVVWIVVVQKTGLCVRLCECAQCVWRVEFSGVHT